jgi:hypothetical protein
MAVRKSEGKCTGESKPYVHMKTLIPALTLLVVLGAGPYGLSPASGQSTFQAVLTGSQEFPANSSTATGFGTLVLNAAKTQITVNESWSGLSTNATASHIHGPAGVGTNASVIFGFTGVPSATSGSIPEQTFAINAQQVAWLEGGFMYMNVHNSLFPGGEIRGQLAIVPEPATIGLVTTGLGLLVWSLRRRARRT